MTTGLNANTFENLQLGAGVFLMNMDLTGMDTAEKIRLKAAEAVAQNTMCLGATRGGGSFHCVPEWRQVEADGLRTPCVGSTVLDGWNIKLTGTLLEATPGAFAALMGAVDVTTSGSMTTLRPRMTLTEEDHIPTLCWVGDTARGMVLIELTHALNMKGMVLNFTDKGEGTMPFEFAAHALPGDEDDHAPCRVIFFD